MRRALHLLVVIAIFSAVALGAMLAVQALGYTAYDVADISGKAIMAAELRGRIEDVITAYPPLPLLASLPFAFFRPWDIPPALLCAIVLGGILGAALYYAFRGQSASRLVALLAALLVVLNPFVIHAIAGGPGMALLLIAMLMLGVGLFGMSGEAAAPDVMMTALALALLAFVHPFGLFIVLASLPGLALAAPPAMLARTPGSLFLILLFPVGFSLFSFTYTRWALGVEPLAFLDSIFGAASSEQSAIPQQLSHYLAETVPALILTAPLLIAFPIWLRKRPSQFLPAAALVATVLLAGLLQVILHNRAQTALVLASALPIAGICAARAVQDRPWPVVLLLCLGAVGAASTLASFAWLRGAPLWSVATLTRSADVSPASFTATLCSKRGVLVDTAAYPGVVDLCGTARGLVVAGEPDFDLQIQSRRLTSAFVLVGLSEATTVLDRIAHTFPDLYEHGVDGYERLFDGGGWRLYGRVAPQPMS